MAKSYDEKREAFQRMLEGRLPKAVKQVELLANLSRGSDYAYTNRDVQIIADSLDDAVDTVLQAFGVKNDEEMDISKPRLDDTGAAHADAPSSNDLSGAANGSDERVVRGDSVCADTSLPVVDGRVDGLGQRDLGPVGGRDKADIKRAFMMIAKDDKVHGMKLLRSVILGWGHTTDSQGGSQ